MEFQYILLKIIGILKLNKSLAQNRLVIQDLAKWIHVFNISPSVINDDLLFSGIYLILKIRDIKNILVY